MEIMSEVEIMRKKMSYSFREREKREIEEEFQLRFCTRWKDRSLLHESVRKRERDRDRERDRERRRKKTGY